MFPHRAAILCHPSFGCEIVVVQGAVVPRALSRVIAFAAPCNAERMVCKAIRLAFFKVEPLPEGVLDLNELELKSTIV